MSTKLLDLVNITKSYDGVTILDDLNLYIRENEFLTLLGPSGCGKSTLLRCINALEPVQDGSISLHGKDIRKGSKNITEMRQKIGMVFQSYELFPHLTVLDNITLSPVKVQKRKKDEVKAEAMELLQRVGLADKAASYPRQLSGGQKQRVAIVRALAMSPSILFFDEPTSALDPELTGEILEVIRLLADDHMTMVIVTHEMSFARAISNRVIFMADGYIVEEGAPEQIFERPTQERTKQFLAHYQ